MIILSVGFLIATLIVGSISGTAESRTNALGFLVLHLDPLMFIKRPWTLVTHLFINISFISGLFNLVTLFFFGKMFADFVGMHRLWPVYLYSGFTGSILAFSAALIGYGFHPPATAILIGGVAPAMALLTAVMVIYPDLRINTLFFNNVPLKYFGIVFLVLGLLSAANGIMWVSLVAYTGTIAFGFLYGYLFKRNRDLSTGFVNLIYRIERSFGKKPRMKVVYGRPLSDDEYNTIKKEQEATLDELLDKISTKGIKSLSKKEKELLDRYSKQ